MFRVQSEKKNKKRKLIELRTTYLRCPEKQQIRSTSTPGQLRWGFCNSMSSTKVGESKQDFATPPAPQKNPEPKPKPEAMFGTRYSHEPWNAEALSLSLKTLQDYNLVVPMLRLHTDTFRNSEAVSWAEECANEGHVPIAIHVVRNILKSKYGPVPNVESIHFAFRISLLILLRTVQDVHGMRHSLGHVVDEGVFRIIRDKLLSWLSSVPQHLVPKLSETVDSLKQNHPDILKDTFSISPYWIGSVKLAWTSVLMGGHIDYGTPASVSINAWNRDESFSHVRRDRKVVANQMLDMCQGLEWNVFFKMDLDDFLKSPAATP